MSDEVRSGVRRIVGAHGRLPVGLDSVADSTDLWGLGMSSHASVEVLLAIESEFDVEFSEAMLRRATFESIDNLSRAVVELRNGDG